MSGWSLTRAGMAVVVSLGVIGCARVDQAANGQPVVAATDESETPSAFGSYLAGRHAQQVHDYARAADLMARALADDPANAELMQRTFLLSLSQGRMEESVALAQRIVAVDPNAPIARLVLVVDRIKAGDYQGAAAAVAKLPKTGAQQFAAPLMTAWIDLGLDRPAAAASALAGLGDIRGLATLKDFHTALVDDFAGRTAEAEELYRKALAAQPRANWRVVEMLGNFYERNGKGAEARTLYQRFAAETHGDELVAPALKRIADGTVPPRRVASPRDGAAEALFDLASLLNQRETVDLALLYGRLVLDLRPGYELVQLLIADIDMSEGRHADALALFRAIDPASPFGWSARLKVASELNALDRTDEAVAELKAMAAQRPQDPQPLIELGDMLRGRSRFADAVTAYDQAIARLGTVGPNDWSVLYSRGVALERSGQWPRAEADLEQALSLEPDQPLVLNYLGYSWIEKGVKLPQALKMVKRAAELRPNDGYIVDSLGWALYQLGDYATAARTLERAIELLPEDATINDHLGDAYWQVGRQAEARYQWRRALQFKPDSDQAKIIDAKLDRGLAKPAAAASGG